MSTLKIQKLKNKIMEYPGIRFLMFCLVFLDIFLFSEMAFSDLTIKVNHDRIKINFVYHGSSVSVSGVADSGTDLVIKIASPESHQTLRKKGKAAGFLWMNIGELKLEHASNLYFLHSTRKLDDILNSDEMDKFLIGYPSMERHVEITPVDNENDESKWFNEFVKYKESSKLYDISSGKISVTDKDGKQNFYIQVDWPYQAPPGDYLVTVYVVKDKRVIDKAEKNVLAEEVGIVKALSDMANNKGALYGMISVIAALGTGFGVGMIFGKGTGAH